jgi:phosphoglycolate phosphatase
LKRFASIGFDLDGTLWDFTPNAVTAWTRVLAREPGHIAPPTLEAIRSCTGLSIDAYAPLLLPALKGEPQRMMAVCRRCVEENYRVIAQSGGVLYPGVEEMLRNLSQEHALYIASNCDPPYIEGFLDYFGFRRYFADRISYGETKCTKGENIRLVQQRSGFADTLFVGDMPTDFAAAQTAGVPFVHAAYGFGRVPQAAQAIRAPGELAPLVARLEAAR